MTKSKLILGAAALVATTAAYANPFTGKLSYTTFQGGVNVHSIDYAYDGSAIVYSNNTDIATTNGADGILFAPDGNLLVAGQANNIISEITPTGTPVATVAAGTGSYHLALSSNDPIATLCNMWNGGSGASVSALTRLGESISGALAGTPYTVAGVARQDVRGMVYDPANNTWYYGTAAEGAAGDFGTVSFTGTTATLTPIASGEFAHGLTFDPFTNTIIFSSENIITQFDPVTNTFCDLTSLPNGNYDQRRPPFRRFQQRRHHLRRLQQRQ